MESRALFREIHKNTWLKRVVDSRKTGVINKKSDKCWVVFCVHDDSIALLEGYAEPKFAPTHNPEWSVSLQGALHVSHSLVPVENEFEFVITLQNDVARFNAPSWELMLEWVDTLRSKLREMKILSPRENVYSKLPEVRVPLLPTRDPTSPLPAPPIPAALVLVPGVESPQVIPILLSTTNLQLSQQQQQQPAMSNTSTQNLMNLLSNPLEAYANNTHSEEDVVGEETTNSTRLDVATDDDASATNITIIQVSSQFGVNNEVTTNDDYRSNVQIIPSTTIDQPHCIRPNQVTKVQVTSNTSNDYGVVFPVTSHSESAQNGLLLAPVTNISVGAESSQQHYEQVFLASTSTIASDQPSTSSQVLTPSSSSVSSGIQRQVQANGRPQLNRGQTEISISRPSRSNVRAGGPTRMRAENQIDKMRCDQQEQRRRSSSTSDMGERQEIRRLQQPPQPFRPMIDPAHQNGNRMTTLREQQVANLRREMMHLGGVRLQLRRKDCIGSIAWIDAFGAVWVAGWKQKEHPVLYTAFHIGDQLISVAGQPISNAAEANKVIRTCQGLFVELIIRRVPFGRVYAIRREIEGQCLGLIRDGNTSTIVDVVPNSLAARFGLPPKSKTVDGLNLTFWALTEINSRPLSLFFKDNEIKDRLNSVGRDISILVQPSDLVTKLKKQLKSLRGYKDFIVQ